MQARGGGEGRLWIVTREPRACRRFELLLESVGMTACVASRPEELLDGGAAPTGVVLVDSAQLGPSDMKIMGLLRDRGANIVTFRCLEDGGESRTLFCESNERSAVAPREVSFQLAPRLRMPPFLAAIRGFLHSPERRIRAEARSGLVWTRALRAWRLTTPLTCTELWILCLLMTAGPIPVDRSAILRKIWGGAAEYVNSETISKHVQSLRVKLGRFGRAIRTIYGRGYALRD